MTAKLDSIQVFQQNMNAQTVSWKLWVLNGDTAGLYTVSVRRAYAENGDYEIVNTVPAVNSFLVDEDVNLHDQWRKAFYKLDLKKSGSSVAVYGPVSLNTLYTTRALALVKHSKTALKLSGEPVLVYSRAFDDTHCPDCWDAVLQQVVSSSCETCFNTGYVNGFYTPILTLAHITPEIKSNTPGDTLRQKAVTQMTTSIFPVLRPRDVIYEINNGVRYRIISVTPIEHGRSLINQTAQIQRLNPSDVEQTMAVPDITTLTPFLRRNRAASRLFVHGDNGESISVVDA